MVVDRNNMMHDQDGRYSGRSGAWPSGADDLADDPDVMFEENARAAIGHAVGRADDLERTDEHLDLLRRVVDESTNGYEESPLSAFRMTSSEDFARQVAGADGSQRDLLDEAVEYGSWDPKRDAYARFDDDGNLEGLTRRGADDLLWRNRKEILSNASIGGEDHIGDETIRRLAAL